MSNDDMTEDAKPEGVNELDHKKLPCINHVVNAVDTEHSIVSDSKWLFRKI
jgi:hypothetical protein